MRIQTGYKAVGHLEAIDFSEQMIDEQTVITLIPNHPAAYSLQIEYDPGPTHG